jgi:hypothetical protein
VMIISRLEPSEKIPAELREIYAHLAGGLLDTLGVLDELTVLFSASKEAVALMNTTAPTFFVRHEQLLIDHIILFVSRVTDDKQSGSRKNRQENLTLEHLLNLPSPEPPGLRADLHRKLTTIKEDAKQMRLYRHKFLAHASMVHHVSSSTKLGDDITLKSMRVLLDKIGEYISAFEGPFTGVVGAEFHYPRSYGEAADLLAYLKLGVETEEKENEERLKAATALSGSQK